ncbi:FLJ37770-like protein [Trichonephila clavipes]|nr:FLJ37770-like protein [Trichonephila clavipes]
MASVVEDQFKSRTPEIIEKVQNFVANDCCASLRMMVDSLNINKETIRTLLHENLGKTKVCAKFVPHTLSPEQKAMRIAHAKDILSATVNDSNFLKFIVTGVETWCFQHDPERKRKVRNGSQKIHLPVPFWIVDTERSMGERNVHADRTPGWEKVTRERCVNL